MIVVAAGLCIATEASVSLDRRRRAGPRESHSWIWNPMGRRVDRSNKCPMKSFVNERAGRHGRQISLRESHRRVIQRITARRVYDNASAYAFYLLLDPPFPPKNVVSYNRGDAFRAKVNALRRHYGSCVESEIKLCRRSIIGDHSRIDVKQYLERKE